MNWLILGKFLKCVSSVKWDHRVLVSRGAVGLKEATGQSNVSVNVSSRLSALRGATSGGVDLSERICIHSLSSVPTVLTAAC